MVVAVVPPSTSTVPVTGAVIWFVTHTVTPPEERGSGEPKKYVQTLGEHEPPGQSASTVQVRGMQAAPDPGHSLLTLHAAPLFVPPTQVLLLMHCREIPAQFKSLVHTTEVSSRQRWLLNCVPPALSTGPVVLQTPHVDASGCEQVLSASVSRLPSGACASCD